jgi:two-component system chemotaxis sensor kinase CheA
MPERGEELRARLMATFKVEAEDHLNAITGHLAALERGLPPEEVPGVVEGAFRAVHTLKGAARSVGLGDVESLCQALEQTFSRAKRAQLALSRELLGRVQEAVDGVARLLGGGAEAVGVAELVRRLEDPAAPRPERQVMAPPPAPSVAPSAPAAAPAGQTIRIDTARLESLHRRAEELLAVKLSVEERVREARGLAESLAHCREQVGGVALAEGPGGQVRDAEAQARVLLERLLGDRRNLGVAVDGLHEEARRVRMMPVSSIVEPFARMVGELARAQAKEVAWEVQGAELEADRKVLETIKDPLLHLLRNAIDHGIEPPDRRERAGKPRRGRLSLRVLPLEGRRIEVCVEDDGAGIDVAGVRAAAVRARVMDAEEAEALPEEAALRLMLSSGVSTSSVVTELSGHGLGMAIASEAVERLGGELLVETRSGAGTTVRMLLPAAVATFRGLLLRAARQDFLLSIGAVERVLRVSASELASAGGRGFLRLNGRALPAGSLAAALGRGEEKEAPADGHRRPCVVLAAGEDRGAFLVDEVLGEREVLVKELTPPLVRVRHVAGAGLLGSGEVVLILRPADVLHALREVPAEPQGLAAAEEAPPAILVVDDSITTRTMERNLLESAGYRVEVAVDGMEAWTALKTGRFDLVLADVDMPRMNGFDLTARIRADAALAGLPVVLVTALESREDKEHGIEAGANAYVIKSGFDQSKLLEIIRRLV